MKFKERVLLILKKFLNNLIKAHKKFYVNRLEKKIYKLKIKIFI